MKPIRNILFVTVLAFTIPVAAWAQFDTEITSYKGKLYSTSAYGSWDNKVINISESTDSVGWARIEQLHPAAANQSSSYGNPRFSIGPNGKLMLSCKSYPNSLTVWETTDGRDWKLRPDLVVKKAHPQIVSDFPLDTGLVWDDEDAYFLHCGSGCGDSGLVELFSRNEGFFKLHRRWMKPNNDEPDEGAYDDSDLLNVGEKLICVTNSDTATRIGIANAPYKDWKWSKLVPTIKKPKLLQLPDDRILVTGAQGNVHSLFQLSLAANRLDRLKTIPASVSGPSRVGMTLHKGELWVGYRVRSGNGYYMRTEKINLDDLRPTIPKGSLSELVEQMLAQPELQEDNALLAAKVENPSGQFAPEVLRRRNSIVETLARIEFDEIGSRPVRERIMALGPKTRALVAPVLCRQIMSQNSLTRQRARDALCHLTGIPDSAVPVLLQAAQNPSHLIRESALQVLCYVRTMPESAEPTLRARLTGDHGSTRAFAAASLLSLNQEDESAKRVIAGFLSNSQLWKRRNPDRTGVSQEEIRQLRMSPLDPVNTLLTGRAETVWPLVIERLEDRNVSHDLKLFILRDLQQYYTRYKFSIPRDRLCRFAVSPAAQQDPPILEAALKALARLGNFDGANLQALSSGPPTAKRWLAQALGSATVNRGNAIKILRKLSSVRNIATTHDTFEMAPLDQMTRDNAIESLARLNVAHERLIARLTADLQSDDVGKKNDAIHESVKVIADEPELLPMLIKLLEDDSVEKGFGWHRYYPCENVVNPLVAMGRPAVPALIGALESKDADARCFAAQALGQIGANEAIEPLVSLLKDDQSVLSYNGKIKKREEIHVSALNALAALGPETGPFLPQFETFLDQESTREAAIGAIAKSGPAGVRLIPKLKKLRTGALEDSERRGIDFAIACLSFDAPEQMEGMRVLLMRIAKNPQSNEDLWLARDTLAFVQSQRERSASLIPELSYLVNQHEDLNLIYRAYAAAALAHIDPNNPRWRSLFDRWYADQFGRDPWRTPFWDMTRIWKVLRQMEVSARN